MMNDIVEQLRDLHKQATHERSHYYASKRRGKIHSGNHAPARGCEDAARGGRRVSAKLSNRGMPEPQLWHLQSVTSSGGNYRVGDGCHRR